MKTWGWVTCKGSKGHAEEGAKTMQKTPPGHFPSQDTLSLGGQTAPLKGRLCPLWKESVLKKKTLPNLNTKSSGEAEGWGLEGWAVGTCLSTAVVRARMEHEENGGGGGGGEGEVKKGEKRRWWRTDGRGSEVDGGRPAAGGLGESGHHAGQGPVLSLQPLLNLPQGLNLLYLGEVLMGRGGARTRPEEGGGCGRRVNERREDGNYKKRGTDRRKRGRRKRRLLENEERIWSRRDDSEFCWWTEWKHDSEKISQLSSA